jgi:hypothetical protein
VQLLKRRRNSRGSDVTTGTAAGDTAQESEDGLRTEEMAAKE